MAILADEKKVRTMLDRAYFLGMDVQRAFDRGISYQTRGDLQAHFDTYIEELKTA